MAGIGVSEEWLEAHGFVRIGMSSSYMHEPTDIIHTLSTNRTWITELDESVELFPRSGKELLLCVKLRTEDRP